MTNRKLLERAARAAGLGTLAWGETFKLGDDLIDCSDLSYLRSNQRDEADVYWNPLIDDADAFRLAVRLRILPVIEDWSDGPWVFVPSVPGEAEPLGTDPYAATRRAIVHAAAAMDKGGER